MSDFSAAQIGIYQLRNLVQQNIQFRFLDLRRSNEPFDLLKNAIRVPSAEVLQYVSNSGLTPEDPIVLICEDGSESLQAAEALSHLSFINVFVVAGGVRSLVSP